MLDLGKTQHLIFNPFLKVFLRCNLSLELLIIDDTPFKSVDQQHPTRLQTSLLNDFFWVDGDSADFRCTDHHVVGSDIESTRPETVTIEICTTVSSVGESEQGRPVPWFHLASSPLIEGSFVRVHKGVVLPSLWNHHHNCFRQ